MWVRFPPLSPLIIHDSFIKLAVKLSLSFMEKYSHYIDVVNEQTSKGKKGKSFVLRKVEDGSQLEMWDDESHKLVNYEFVLSRMSSLLGKALTIVDSSVVDSRQNKAMKDLIKSEFVGEYCDLCDLLFPKGWIKHQEENANIDDILEIDEDEALGLK